MPTTDRRNTEDYWRDVLRQDTNRILAERAHRERERARRRQDVAEWLVLGTGLCLLCGSILRATGYSGWTGIVLAGVLAWMARPRSDR